jgi:hypothetical protein
VGREEYSNIVALEVRTYFRLVSIGSMNVCTSLEVIGDGGVRRIAWRKVGLCLPLSESFSKGLCRKLN